MNAVISGTSLKLFTRALRNLVRFSTELYIEATKESLILRSVNQSKDCFLSIFFHKLFFVSYQAAPDNDFEGNNCRVSIRQLIMALRNIKNVINCKINLDSKKEILEVNLIRPQDYTFQNFIRVLEYEALENFGPPTDGISKIICKPSSLSDILNIPKNLPELELDIKTSSMEIRNHIIRPDQDVQTVRLKYPLDIKDFIAYEIKKDVSLIVLHQAFDSILEFTESSKDEVKLEFTVNGEPLIISVDNDEFVKVELVTSTLVEEDIRKLEENRPHGATTYRALIESYIEKRHSASEADLQPVDLTESEMAKNLSPHVSSFQAPLRTNRKSISNKRKGFDTTTDSEKNQSVEDITKDQSKKQKVGAVDASHFLAQLNEKDDEEATPNNIDFLGGLSAVNVKAHSKVNNTMDENMEVQHNSEFRFDISKALLPSEEIEAPVVGPPTRRVTVSVSAAKANAEKALEIQRLAEKAKLDEKKKKAALLFPFEPILHPRPYPKGIIVVRNSDSSDSEA